jgi:hypothetical protein
MIDREKGWWESRPRCNFVAITNVEISMRISFSWILAAIVAGGVFQNHAADPVFSGPQPGERTSGFKVSAISGTGAKTERDPVAEGAGKPVALVFMSALERSLVPLLRVVDEYGAQRREHLRTEIIYLSEDRVAGEGRIQAAANALRMKSNVGLSLDGAEGPGNYGLNKECMMTIVVAKDNRVTANFALVQPGIADAPKVIEALAQVSGDANPPTVESLNKQYPAMAARGERGRAREMRNADAEKKDPFPGAVPSDEKLQGQLRRLLRATNDDATVDQMMEEMQAHLKANPDLKGQAIDGWTRVLHFGERYGTPYSRKKAAEHLEALKKESGSAERNEPQ